MRKTVRFVALIGLLFVGGLFSPAMAGDDLQIHNYQFDGDLAIWDVGGAYHDAEMDMDYTMAQDAKGKIAGFGTANFAEDDMTLEMDFVIKGGVKTRGDETLVNFKMKAKGSGDYEGLTFKFTASVDVKTVIDSLVGEMIGTMKLRMTLKAKGYYPYKASEIMTFEEDVPVGMDGSSDLVLTTHAEGDSRVWGDGVLTLSNGEKFNYLVKGKLNVKKATGKLALKATDELSKGSMFKLYTDDEFDLTGVKGKALGQKIKFEKE